MHTSVHNKLILKKGLCLKLILLLTLYSFVYATNSEFEISDKVKVTKYYPTLASSVINFEFSEEVDKTYTLQIYSFIGKQEFATRINAQKITISVKDLFRGIYFFQLRDVNGKIVESGKFSVVH